MSEILDVIDRAEELFSATGAPMGKSRARSQRQIDCIASQVPVAVERLSEAVPSDALFVRLGRPDDMESVFGKRMRCIKLPWYMCDGRQVYRLDVLYE